MEWGKLLLLYSSLYRFMFVEETEGAEEGEKQI